MREGRVIIVDGDRAGREALINYFKFAGLDAFGVADPSEAGEWLAQGDVDLVVLPADMADDARRRFDGPEYLLLTRDPQRRPVPMRQLVERAESLIRERKLARREPLRLGDLLVDEVEGTVSNAGAMLKLGRIEIKLLALFMSLPEKMLSREHILRRLWPANVRVEVRTVDVHVGRLRRALQLLKAAHLIQTVSRSGYRFSAIT